MKPLRAAASGIVIGAASYLAMNSFDISGPRAAAYAILFGAFWLWLGTFGSDK